MVMNDQEFEQLSIAASICPSSDSWTGEHAHWDFPAQVQVNFSRSVSTRERAEELHRGSLRALWSKKMGTKTPSQ